MNKRQKLVQKQFLNNEQEIINRLHQVYDKSLTDINDKIKNLTFSINDLKLEYSWLDDGDPEKERIKSMIQSKIYQKKYQEQLRQQVDGILQRMNIAEFTNISDYLDTCYTDGFIGAMFDMHGQGVPIMSPIDQEAMVRAVQLESKISKGLYTRLGEDVNLLKKKITAQVSRSIASGLSYAQTAKALEGYTRIGYNNAIRIARTEGHRVQTTATMDAMEKAKEKGADILKQWDATLDGRTRESHSQVDGEIRELNKPFSNGLMYPGDPSGNAAEVINCRCALLQRARWALDDEFTKVNGFTDQVESFDSPESYGEFKKAFFSPENKSYMNYVQQMQDKYGTKDFAKVLDSMSDREYNHYSKLLENNTIYNTQPKLINRSDGVDESVLGVKVPVRPKRIDFDNEDSLLKAREKYREDLEAYKNTIDDAVQSNLAKTRQFTNKEDIKQWAKKNNIVIDDEVFDKIDIRAFDDYIETTEELFRKYPEVLDTIGGVGGHYRIGVTATTDELADASGGFQFGNKFKDYEDVLHEQFESMTSGDLVQGDGTIKGLYRHEFGHNLQFAITQNLDSTAKRIEFKKDLVESLKNTKGVSEYALTNADELFAEGFAAFESGENNEFAEEFGKFLNRWMPNSNKYLAKSLTNTGNSDIIRQLDIGTSVGAKAKNYPVKLLNSKQHVKLAEGQTIKGTTFAGNGTNTEIRERFRLEADYKIPADKWEKVSGDGIIVLDGKQLKAELHWYEADGEVFEMKVKRYLQ